MFMKRSSGDEFSTLKACDAVESSGGEVVAITPDGIGMHEGAQAPHHRYIVWARVRDVAHCDEIDEKMSRLRL